MGLAKKKVRSSKPSTTNDDQDCISANAAFEELRDILAEKLQMQIKPEVAAQASSLLPIEQKELLQVLKQLREKLASLQTGACGALLSRSLSVRSLQSNKVTAEKHGPAEYMEMKVQLLLSYLILLSYYLLLKTSGASIKDHPVVTQMLWIRTLLDKLKPVDQRLQYQTTKMLQWVDAQRNQISTSDEGALDPRALKPGQLTTSVQDEDDEEDDEPAAGELDADGAIYKPPKVAQVEYTGDHIAMQERAEKELERKKARLERSEFVRGLREEFTDAPREIQGVQRSERAQKIARQMREQQEYEEENMTRLRLKKADLRAQRRALREGRALSGGTVSLQDATLDFNEIARGLENQRSRQGKGKGKGKGKRKGGGVLQEFEEARRKVQRTRDTVADALDNVPGKRRRGGGPISNKRKR